MRKKRKGPSATTALPYFPSAGAGATAQVLLPVDADEVKAAELGSPVAGTRSTPATATAAVPATSGSRRLAGIPRSGRSDEPRSSRRIPVLVRTSGTQAPC